METERQRQRETERDRERETENKGTDIQRKRDRQTEDEKQRQRLTRQTKEQPSLARERERKGGGREKNKLNKNLHITYNRLEGYGTIYRYEMIDREIESKKIKGGIKINKCLTMYNTSLTIYVPLTSDISGIKIDVSSVELMMKDIS